MNVATEPFLSAETNSEQRSRGVGKWTRSRWLFVIALIFAVHVGLIFALSDRKQIVPRQPVFTTQLRLAGNGGELFALNDPTLFALPHANGFSGAGWMKISRTEMEPFQWSEPPRWLQLPVEQLGASFLRFMQTNEFAHFSPELKSPPQLMPSATPSVVTIPEGKSTLLIEGDLAARKLLNVPVLPPWPAADLLASSFVQVLVDETGNVISTVLLPPGSGSKDADQSALILAKSVRFAPLQRSAPNTRKLASSWTRGRMIFQWFTVPQSQTNALPAGP